MNVSALLPYRLDRTVLIRAPREAVFRYFSDSRRFASWWGLGSTIDPRIGGTVAIRHPNGIEAGGEVLAIDPPARIVFSYGFASGDPIPIGASRVEIDLAEESAGTRLALAHHFPESGARDHHVQGWRYQLALFANVVADEIHENPDAAVDGWFAAWSEPDAAKRSVLLERHVSPLVCFRDRFSAIDGLDDLEPHLAAVHVFMPGMRLERVGPARHCQGTVVADWVARGADGGERGKGTNVFTLDPTNRVEEVVGLWA